MKRSAVAIVTIGCSIVIWTLMLLRGENLAIQIHNWGFPLTYYREYAGGFARDFPVALIFDLLIATMAVIAAGYCSFFWSASWTNRNSIFYILSGASLTVILLIIPQLSQFLSSHGISPAIIGLPLLFLFLIIIPMAWCISMFELFRMLGIRLVGEKRSLLVPVGVGLLLFGLGWFCYPRYVFYHHDRQDIPELRGFLSDENPRIRSYILACLRGLAPYDEETEKAILRALTDADPQVRDSAVSLAPRLGSLKPKAFPILLKRFEERGSCIQELTEFGPMAKQALPAMKAKLPASEGYSKLSICEALWKIEKNTDLVVPALIDLLNDDFGPLRVDAAQLLGEIGPPSKVAIPTLKKMVEHSPPPEKPPQETHSSKPSIRHMTEAEFYPQVRAAAKHALNRIQTETPIPPTDQK